MMNPLLAVIVQYYDVETFVEINGLNIYENSFRHGLQICISVMSRMNCRMSF